MFWYNLLKMSFILMPALIVFGMIIFAGKPKPPPELDEVASDEERPPERHAEP